MDEVVVHKFRGIGCFLEENVKINLKMSEPLQSLLIEL